MLLGLREYQDSKADVILKFFSDEARKLKMYGELPDTARINETDTFGAEGDGGVKFDVSATVDASKPADDVGDAESESSYEFEDM